MNTQKLLLNIDEFTFTILPQQKIDINIWDPYAESIIYNFVQSSHVDKVFAGEVTEMESAKLEGYSRSFNMGLKDYYFAMAYNPYQPTMGVCVRFSAKAWAIYQVRYKNLYDDIIHLPKFLHMVSDNCSESVRLSRVDMTVDYFDYDIILKDIYDKLMQEKLLVQDNKGRNRIRTIEFQGKNNQFETIYIGSRGTNSRGFLRIYDKRIEQIETNGFRNAEALACSSWIRFEAVFKGKYAHAIAEEFLKYNMDTNDLKKYIAQMIGQKYRFYDTTKNEYEIYTRDLLEVSEGNNFASLRVESPRDNALYQSINHIKHGSGLFPTLYKIRELYGKDAEKEFLEYLFKEYKNGKWMGRTMYKELTLWLKKHEDLKECKLSDNY